ncbi:hypothetical protein [Actinoplanes regularis]|uniref:ABC-2 type transport system permease protein n=1 Tax=Actinoplanes regularis TaxID=52697 RepID=A0A238YS41_9ACTN|nr:hypothetical protein [Actinoplanes regularis]GIE85510.1 transport permease protein [Actinoplanes regularis]SNR73782.1 ABC-2 type transport system permease protein [Actinoplanes regularis]
MIGRLMSLVWAELTLLRRSPLAVVNALLLPLALGVGWLLLAENTGKGTDGDTTAMQLLMLLSFTPYAGVTTALAARRADLVLKRMRTTALPPLAVISGLAAPYAVLTAGQIAVLTALHPPPRWWPLLVTAVTGTVLAVALAFATAAFTPVPELAQLTTTPGVLAFFGGGMWLLHTGDASWPMRAVPGVPVAELARAAWQDGTPIWPALSATAVLTTAAVALAVRAFRWEPRR